MAARRAPPALHTPGELHETLMGSMMARSTPRVLFHSRHVRRIVTLLEVAFALHAVALFILLFSLHARFVRSDGCAGLLDAWDLSAADDARTQTGTAPVIELAIRPWEAVPEFRFRFSHERGFLLLSEDALVALNVSVASVELHPDHPCLGGPVARVFLERMVGYETVAVNAFARMRRRIKRHGYVLSLPSRRVVNLVHADPGIDSNAHVTATRVSLRIIWKCGALMTAIFIMCTTGALVTFTLKEVQVRMIKLTLDLQYIMRTQLGYGRVILRYAMDALVFVPIVAGMLFFLFEFFDDQALAFSVLIISWLCEFAASGSTRHWVSRLYLPRLFFCYFGAFHLYFFSFPLGFSWLALVTSIAFMFHAALTVWNHCELPLLRRERAIESEWR